MSIWSRLMRSRPKSRFRKLSERVSTLEQANKALRSALSEAGGAGALPRLDRDEERLDTVSGQITGLLPRVVGIEPRLTATETRLSDSDIASRNLADRVHATEASIIRIDQMLRDVDASMRQIWLHIERLDRMDGGLVHHLSNVESAIASTNDTFVRHTEQVRSSLQQALDHEAKRLDYALGEIEGLGAERDAFQKARRTPEYRAAFTQKEPLVSVCVTTHNQAVTLTERCLPSLIAQSYGNLQIIVVGDHCTDDTEECVRALNDSRIEFYNLPEPSTYPAPGVDRWRVAGTVPGNFARQQARGMFISHLDDDDSSLPERIARCVEAAQAHEADFVWHMASRQMADGRWLPLGSGEFKHGQLNLGMCLYHHYFRRLTGNIFAYRANEPGDWNALRRIGHLRPRLHFVPEELTRYYAHSRSPFVAREDEVYLD